MVGRKLGLAVTAAALALGYTSVPAVALDLGTRLTGREESALMADFARTDQQCKTGVPGDARTVAACLARNDIRKKLAFDANLCPGSTGGWVSCHAVASKMTPAQYAQYRSMMAYSLALQRCHDAQEAARRMTGELNFATPYNRCE
jgi:hypothetical protein